MVSTEQLSIIGRTRLSLTLSPFHSVLTRAEIEDLSGQVSPVGWYQACGKTSPGRSFGPIMTSPITLPESSGAFVVDPTVVNDYCRRPGLLGNIVGFFGWGGGYTGLLVPVFSKYFPGDQFCCV